VTARHRLPTGTGPTATQPLSRSLGRPSFGAFGASADDDQGSSAAISNSSAYMHLSAHLFVLFLFFLFFLLFFDSLGDSGTTDNEGFSILAIESGLLSGHNIKA
jgi:hypothetical protein